MGLISKLLGRRVRKIDAARMALFDLDDDEFPVEAQSASVVAMWPSAMGLPMELKDARKLSASNPFGTGPLPLKAVMMATSTHLRWVPYRFYRGSRVFNEFIDRQLSDGPEDRDNIYGLFSSDELGPRSVPISHIKRVSLDYFDGGDAATVNVHLIDEYRLDPALTWPYYELSGFEDQVPLPPDLWRDGFYEPAPFLQFYTMSAESLTFATQMSQGFSYLEVPFQTESLIEPQLQQWEMYAQQMERKRPWRTLNQRMSQG